jgi:hypothetical protein
MRATLNAVLIAVALLVASLVRPLVFVFFEVPLLAVVQVMRMVRLTFTHTLLVLFVFRIIRARALVPLEKWSSSRLCRAPDDNDTRCYR